MSLTVSSAPSVEPISTAEAKEYLRIDTSDTSQDNVIALLIAGVRQRFEDYLRRALITQTLSYEMSGDDLRQYIEIPRPPVQSITSLTTYDEASGSETSTVVASTNYQLIEKTLLVERNDGWTINREDRAGTLVYVAGYGNASTDIPQDIVLAMLEMLALRFERRGDEDRDFGTTRENAILESVSGHMVYGV